MNSQALENKEFIKYADITYPFILDCIKSNIQPILAPKTTKNILEYMTNKNIITTEEKDKYIKQWNLYEEKEMEEKLVTAKNLTIGQEIKGTEGNGCHCSFSAYVKSVNPAYVIVEMWRPGGNEKRLDASLMFKVTMTKEEFENKYQEGAKEVLKGIQNKLCLDEIGYHEMWNSWLYGTPYEIAAYCTENKMKVIGYSTDIVPKIAMFSGDTLDVGVCAEYEDGDRIWCHYKSEDIQEMVKKYQNLLK